MRRCEIIAGVGASNIGSFEFQVPEVKRNEQTSSMRTRATRFALALLLGSACQAVPAPASVERDLDRSFAETVHPFLETYCFGCHGEEKQKGKLNLHLYSTREAAAKDYPRWETVREKLKAEEMPPDEAKRHPSPELRRRVINWIETMRRHEA